MEGNSSNGLPVSDETTRNSLCPRTYSITGTPTPTGSRVAGGVPVGMRVMGANVCPGVGGTAIGANVAGAQAVRMRLRQRPGNENHRGRGMGISPFLRNIHHLQGERSRNYAV